MPLAPVLPALPNGSFETLSPATGFAEGWVRGVSEGTRGEAVLDTDLAFDGERSLRISDATPTEAYRYVLVNSEWLTVTPQTTYLLRFHLRGAAVGKCFAGIGFEGAGEHRQSLPAGDYDWREATCRFTVPAGCTRVSVHFLADGVTDGLWIDDVSLEISPVQLANIAEPESLAPEADWIPRTPGPPSAPIAVADARTASRDERALLTALQGIVNRGGARLYLLSPTNPADYDAMWLDWLLEKRYLTREAETLTVEEALRRFGGEVRGAIVWDPALPGSQHAAWMLAGLEDALPASAEVAERYGLPIVEDLRGRFASNLEACRAVIDAHWTEMSHRLLAWEYPLTDALTSRDMMVQQKVPMFWVSSHLDGEPGADPAEEMAFAEELLARTPGNVPVMGWPMHGSRGVEEYTAVRLLSEFAKWVPGTSFNSNASVMSAIRPPEGTFRQHAGQPPSPTPTLSPDKLYVSINILDSGDAQWYWQFYQRTIWEDPTRGSVPTGYAMNMTVLEALPPVAAWYYEHMAPNDSFFGFLYMNAPVYASRYRAEDRERIWGEFVRRTGALLEQGDMEGLELYTGGTGGPSGSEELLRRFTSGIPGLRYILSGLGRHPDVEPDRATVPIDGVPVFRTLTNFRVWTDGEDLTRVRMEDANAWLAGELAANAPNARPGFASGMAISWMYRPSWLADLRNRLPADCEMVSPGDLARLWHAARH